MTETPETSPSGQPDDTAAHQNETTSEETNAADSTTAKQVKEPVRSPWLWLVAGLLAAIINPFVFQAAVDAEPARTDEHNQLAALEQPNNEEAARLAELDSNVANGSVRRRLASVGITVSALFGLFAGIIYGRIGMGVLGAIVGAAIAFVLMPVTSQWILDLESQALLGGGDDIKGIALHSLQWMVIGLAAAAGMLLGAVKLSVGGKGLGLWALTAVLAGVLYVIVATALDANNQTSAAMPAGGWARYLWTSLPPVVAGFFMARTK